MGNKSEYLAAYEKTPQQFMDNPIIHWEAIWWIERPTALWIIEIFFALISLVEALLVAYLSYKVNVCTLNSPRYNDDSLRAGQHFAANHFVLLHPGIGQHHSLHFHGITNRKFLLFHIKLLTDSHWSTDVLLAVASPVHSRLPQLLAGQTGPRKHVCELNLVPHFVILLCSSKKQICIIILSSVQNDLHRAMQRSQSALSQQLMVLSATLLCLVFTRSVFFPF